MFRNSDSDSDAEAGHTRSGRSFSKVPLANLFKKSYGPLAQDKDFYSGEEAGRSDKEYSEFTRAEEAEVEELHREEPETSGTAPTVEVSIATPLVVLATVSNQSNQSTQSIQSLLQASLVHTQLGKQGRSMEDEMRLPIFRGDGSEDPDQHWFLCEVVWSIKKVTNEVVKRDQFSTTLRDRALRWYMKFVIGSVQPKPLNDIKTTLSEEFKKPKSESQCIIELKEIK
jgi:hypothetical protein